MQTILVASGTSKNKLNFATTFIKSYLEEQGVAGSVVGASIYEVDLAEVDPAVIVAIGPHSFDDSRPIVNGTAFITKMNMEQCCDEIISLLTSK